MDRIRWPLLMSFIRIPLLAIGAVLTLGVLALWGQPSVFPPTPNLAALYFIVVNLVCLVLLSRLLRAEGTTMAALLGVSRAHLPRDLLWGVVWLFVLYLPFVAAVIGAMSLLFGADTFTSFEAVFAPAPESMAVLPIWLNFVLAVVVALLFPLTNAPTEELVYRGYAQPRLTEATGRRWIGVIVPTIGFSLQHVMLAPTLPAMLVYAAAFFVWGLGAALIYEWQKRLMPLIAAHFLTNLFFSIVPLILLFSA